EQVQQPAYSMTSSVTREHCWGKCKAERPCGFEVDRQLVFGRCLHRQLGWLFALEDAIDVAGRLTILVDVIRPIGGQAAGGDPRTLVVDRWQGMPGRQLCDQAAVKVRQTAPR